MTKVMNLLGATALLSGTCLISAAHAHTMWINVIPEHESHVIASFAYGDVMPGSELLTPDWWPMHVESYELVAPDGGRSSLGVPKLVTQKKELLASGLQVQPGGDTGRRKFIINARSDKGTYQLVARTPVARLVFYRDEQGEEQYIDQNLTTVPEGVEITRRQLGVNLMQAVFAVGGWTEPAPVGLPLEIVPLSDLHEVGVGDKVRFKVLLNGRAFNPSVGEAEITAYNMSFGDRWGLHSVLKYGEGEFRLSEAGLWRVDARFRGHAADVDAYSGGENLPLSVETSFVFHVKP